MAKVINNNREIGKALFLSGYSQRDIAARVGVSENTVGRWAKDGHWDELREAQRTSKPSVLKDLYAELAEMNRVIQGREDGHRFATKDEALTRSRLVKNIADLEQRYSLGNAVDMGRDFCSFVGTGCSLFKISWKSLQAATNFLLLSFLFSLFFFSSGFSSGSSLFSTV